MSRARSTSKPVSPDIPGKDISPESFPDFTRNENKLGAYLGYTDRAHFRQFRFSAICLTYHVVDSTYCHNISPRKPLELLRDVPKDQWDEKFPLDIPQLVSLYTVETQENVSASAAKKASDNARVYMFAGILRGMTAKVEQ